MKVRHIMQTSVFDDIRLVAGRTGLDREVLWAHVVDIPDSFRWVRQGDLMLTTGYAWSVHAGWQKGLIESLAQRGVAGIIIATGRYLQEVPQAVIDAADRVGLPTFDVPFRIPFVEITEALGREITAEQARLLKRSEEIHRSLTTAALHTSTMQELLQVLSNLIGKEVAVADPEQKLLVMTSPLREGDHSTNEVPHAKHSWDEQLLTFSGFDTHATSVLSDLSVPVRLPGPGGANDRHRIVCPIRAGGQLHGFLWILEGDEPLSDLDMRAAQHGATVAALYLLREQVALRMDRTIQSTFVDTLIRGEITHAARLREQAQLLGFNLDGPNAVGIATLMRSKEQGRFWPLQTATDYAERERVGQLIRAWLQSMGQRPLVSYLMNQVVFPFNINSVSACQQVTRDLWLAMEAEKDLRVLLSFGSIHSGTGGVHQSYQEAQLTATLAPQRAGIVYYEDYKLARLLSAIPREELSKWTTDIMTPIHHEDPSGQLMETLVVLAETGFNQKKAAELLFVHQNTLRYRWRKLERVLKRSLSDFQFRHTLTLAVAAKKLLLAND